MHNLAEDMGKSTSLHVSKTRPKKDYDDFQHSIRQGNPKRGSKVTRFLLMFKKP